jgi:hypothetical protein
VSKPNEKKEALMTVYQYMGIDPGIVHSAIVCLTFDTSPRTVDVQWRVVEGETPDEHYEGIALAVREFSNSRTNLITCEAYRDRGTIFTQHVEMRQLQQLLVKGIKSIQMLDNMGAKKLIRPKLLHLFGLKNFPTTHHQDLEAASRILILGALKEYQANRVLSSVVEDTLTGQPWTVLVP